MSEVYFDNRSELYKYLQQELKMLTSDVDDCDMDLHDYEEEPHKRSTQCSGYIYDSQKDCYYALSFLSDYDWGNSNFNLDTTPRTKVEKIITKTINTYPVKKQS